MNPKRYLKRNPMSTMLLVLAVAVLLFLIPAWASGKVYYTDNGLRSSVPGWSFILDGSNNWRVGGGSLNVAKAPKAAATDSVLIMGKALYGGDTTTNGGTYIGINAPPSGTPGCNADFINLQAHGTSAFKVSKAGNVYMAGTLTGPLLPAAALTYKGAWDCYANDPVLADGVGTTGWTYIASTVGTVNLGHGNITFAIGNAAIYNGSVWQKVPYTTP